MTGKALIDKIIVLVGLVIALGSVGLVYYSHNMIKREPTNQVTEFQELKDSAKAATQQKPYAVKQMIVNILSTGNKLRYLDCELNILTFSEDQKEILKNSEHIIKNAMVAIAAEMSADDLNSVTGKILLESRVKKQVNDELKNPTVKQIYFSRYVVQ
jgi:flagellar FliL protein